MQSQNVRRLLDCANTLIEIELLQKSCDAKQREINAKRSEVVRLVSEMLVCQHNEPKKALLNSLSGAFF